MNAAEYALDVLESHGVRHVFGVPGKGLMGLLHALEGRRGRVDFVLSKHEQGGSYMADGYARARGGLGVCLAISGGAALNLMGGVASAYADSIPLLAITGNAPTSQFGRKAMMDLASSLGDIDLARVAAGLGVQGVRVESLDDLDRSVARFLEDPRPTLLDVRVDPDEIPPGIMSRMKH